MSAFTNSPLRINNIKLIFLILFPVFGLSACGRKSQRCKYVLRTRDRRKFSGMKINLYSFSQTLDDSWAFLHIIATVNWSLEVACTWKKTKVSTILECGGQINESAHTNCASGFLKFFLSSDFHKKMLLSGWKYFEANLAEEAISRDCSYCRNWLVERDHKIFDFLRV